MKWEETEKGRTDEHKNRISNDFRYEFLHRNQWIDHRPSPIRAQVNVIFLSWNMYYPRKWTPRNEILIWEMNGKLRAIQLLESGSKLRLKSRGKQRKRDEAFCSTIHLDMVLICDWCWSCRCCCCTMPSCASATLVLMDFCESKLCKTSRKFILQSILLLAIAYPNCSLFSRLLSVIWKWTTTE